ncbi:hypothetical protein [Phycicoccus sonneratiae]|uniref:Uncharacterized protein n=1 Tax=Phycicoccus sonneratiae TaxID=2807628 RepID=A0ABS2CS26_9MICO|nr:hypothetical protein [Phycicoccus sonneraticus]MBM6402610.1 hypothetical protein [Phycicoccus sonneraticus]
MTTSTAAPEVAGWGRRRLLLVLAGASTLVVCLAAGLVYGVVASLADKPSVPTGRSASVAASTGQSFRDRVATTPMRQVGPEASRGGAAATAPSPSIQVPPATTEGTAGVPTGYPHTPAGAVGQLAAIDTTVLAGMSVPHTTGVYGAWSLPGAPPASRWVMTGNVRAFLTAAAGAADPVLTATPVAAQVKGTDGPGWVLACVLLRLDAVAAATASVAYGHCEPMQWQHDRWMIAAGARPAAAPSTWPGTDLALQAGWRTWVPLGVQD